VREDTEAVSRDNNSDINEDDDVDNDSNNVSLTPPPSLSPVVQAPAPLADQDAVLPVQADRGDGGDLVQGGANAVQQNAAPTQSSNSSPPSQQSTPPLSLPSQDIPVNLDDLPPYHVVHRQYIPTITHIPKAARSDWTRLYTSVCYRVANNPANLANHILYSMLARVILPAGKAPPHPGDTTQAHKIKERIRRWRAGEFRALWEEAIALQKLPVKMRRKKKQQETEVTQESRNAIRSSRLVKEGQYSRAAQALTSAGLVEQNTATTATMLQLHPQGPRVIPRADEPDAPAQHLTGSMS
jgi:hypothetical protein